MTKKDYIKIADAIRTVDNTLYVSNSHSEREAVAEVVDNLCYVLKQDNPRFDSYRFKAACGVLS